MRRIVLLVLLVATFWADGALAVDLQVVPQVTQVYPGEDIVLDIRADNVPPEGLGTVQFRLDLFSPGGKLSGISDLDLADPGTVAVAAPLLAGGATATRSGVGTFILQQQGSNGLLLLENQSFVNPTVSTGGVPQVQLNRVTARFVFSQTHGAVLGGGSGNIATLVVRVGSLTTAYQLEASLSEVVLLDGGDAAGVASELPVSSLTGTTVAFGCQSTVPNLAGLDFSAAQDKLLQAQLAVGSLYELDNASGLHAFDKVLEQSIASGTALDCRNTVDLAVNLPPADVTGLQAGDLPDDQAGGVLLSWVPSVSEDVAGYRVLKGGAVLAELPAPDASGVTLSGLDNQVNHLLKVVAYDQMHNVSAGAAVAAVPRDDVPPALTAGTLASPTNQTGIVWSGTVEPDAVLEVKNLTNGTVYQVSQPVAGTWQATLDGLAEGTNQLRVSARDATDNQTAISQNLVLDTQAPALTLDPVVTPTEQETQLLSGTVETGAVVTVSTDPASVAGSVSYLAGNRWECQLIGLVVGENQITVQAVDAAGNLTVLPQALISYQPPPDIFIQVDPAKIASDNQGTLELTIGLPSTGDTVLVEQIIDFDGNGAADAGEPVIRSFSVTDGAASSYPNIQGDEDGAADGSITTTLGYFNTLDLYHAPADYAFRVTSGSASTEKGFTVNPVTQLQSIAGTVTDGTNPVAGAFVQLVDKWQRPVAWAVSDSLGQYQVEVKAAGDYIVKPLAYGYATANSSTLAINLTAGQNVTNADLVLVPGAYHVTGKLYDAVSLGGIDGVWIRAEGADSYSVAMTDADGNYDMLLPAGSYELLVKADAGPSPIFKGYLGMYPSDAISIDLMQDLAGVDLRLRAPSRVVSGRVVDEYGVGIAGLPVVGSEWKGEGDPLQSFAVTDVNGNYSLVVATGFDDSIYLDDDRAQILGYVGNTIQVDLQPAHPVGNDLYVRKINAWIDGTVKESDGNVLDQISVKAENLADPYDALIKTASDGSYRLGLFDGDWGITTYPVPKLFYYIFLEQTVSLTQGQTAQVDFVKPVNTIVVEKALYDSNKQTVTIQASSDYGVDADLKCRFVSNGYWSRENPMSWIASKGYWEYVEITTNFPSPNIMVYGLEGEVTAPVTTK